MKTITAKQFYSGFDPETGQDFTLEEGDSIEVSEAKVDQLERDGLIDRFDVGGKRAAKKADPPPVEAYSGYAEAKADERVAMIESGDLDLDQLEAIKVDQAEAKKPQKTVQEAVEAALEKLKAQGSGD